MDETTAPRLLLIRPRASSERFLTELTRVAGPVTALISPLIEIVAEGEAPVAAAGEEIVLTSPHAAWALEGMAGRRAHVVGARAAAAARAAGLEVATDAADLAGLSAALAGAGAPLLYLRGRHVSGALATGRRLREVVVYDQRALPLSDEAAAWLAGDRPVLVPLFSARSARLMAEAAGEAAPQARAPLTAVAISDAVAAAWGGAVAGVARRADGPAMLAATVHALGA